MRQFTMITISRCHRNCQAKIDMQNINGCPPSSLLRDYELQLKNVDPYTLLRQQAAEKRDRIISLARDEYRRVIEEIEVLRQELEGTSVTQRIADGNSSIVKTICNLMPKDKAFTLADIADAVRQAHPARKFRTLTLRRFLQQMEKTGIVSKIGRNDHGQSLWAASRQPVIECSRGQLVMIDLAEEILRECGPLAPIALAEKIQARGYRPNSDPRRLVGWLRRAMKKYPGRIVQTENGHWHLEQLIAFQNSNRSPFANVAKHSLASDLQGADA